MAKDIIVKSYDFVESRYKLTPAEAKIIAILASKIEKDDVDFEMHRFSTKFLLEATGIGKDNYDDIKKITENLMKRILGIKDDKRYIQVAFLSAVIYHDNEGYVDLRFDPVLKPYFLELKEKFIKYKIDQVLRLNSFYSIRFYELLIKWEKIGSFNLALDELRDMFDISEHEYKLYGDLKRKVILTAKNELEEKADLYFTFDEMKQSRKVDQLKFFIKRKLVEEPPAIEQLSFLTSPALEESPNKFNQEIISKLTDSFALSIKQAKKILMIHEENYILEILKIVEQDYRNGKVRKLAPYVIKALDEDFRPKQTNYEKEVESKTKGQQEKITKFIKEKEIIQNLETEFKKSRNEKVLEIIDKLSSKEINDEFPEWLLKRNEFTYKMYKSKGKNNVFVQIEFNIFVAEKYLSQQENDFIFYANSKGYNIINKSGEYILN